MEAVKVNKAEQNPKEVTKKHTKTSFYHLFVPSNIVLYFFHSYRATSVLFYLTKH